MNCLYCGSATSVINSRPQKRSNHIWRRRQCVACAAVFTTSEAPDFLKSLSVVHNRSLQPFSRDKLFISINDSLKHRKSAIHDATWLTDTVISKLYPFISSGSLNNLDIARCASSALGNFDKAAATYYQAYHPVN